MITLLQIQNKLSEAIKQSGKTQKEIAERIGVSRSQISCYLPRSTHLLIYVRCLM